MLRSVEMFSVEMFSEYEPVGHLPHISPTPLLVLRALQPPGPRLVRRAPQAMTAPGRGPCISGETVVVAAGRKADSADCGPRSEETTS